MTWPGPDPILTHVTETERLREILRAEFARHRHLATVVLQKLVYRAVFGADHWLAHGHHFEHALRHEWDALAPESSEDRDQAEPALQVIDPDGCTARLHLGPCKAGGVDLEALVGFLVSQPAKQGTPARYDHLWRLVVALAQASAFGKQILVGVSWAPCSWVGGLTK